MKMTLALAIAGALAAPALAQSGHSVHVERHLYGVHDLLADAAAAKASAEARRVAVEEYTASIAPVVGGRLSPAKLVKGAPYSAEVITENNQSLADGNVIARKTAGRIYRDGEGRTRQETVVNGEAKSIQITNPVEGTSVMLLPGSKKAVPLPRANVAHEFKDVRVYRLGDREVRIENGKVSVDGKDVSAGKVELNVNGKEIRIDSGRVWIDGKEVTGGAGPRASAKPGAADKAGEGTVREEVHVRVIRAGDGEKVDVVGVPPIPPVPPVPPGAAAHFPMAPNPFAMHMDVALARAKTTTTALGTKEFDGVKADGKSTMRTIPAGEIGNRNPIVVTTETWHSPELQVTVYSRTLDPRYGETLYRLAGIRRGEPAADLFKVPEDYAMTGKRTKR